ncbi:hypothetical protein EMIHUDRAFT_207283 [Emiliania huxleyi CCMP1516]|uniref:N-alpha-acetyltransferase 40 n=2 Tax=Emiliania huxleyi TaxID=2903 RepID=A0A0D3JF69_EMIH1|nr:hypothetical protein EMIHUDRAFT_207283 [Emiliania huxleyi CCMP1516]EOD22154.1 hypothetical protein EMIHUDRAFT_207283 [Emiliania huxleyi CCMP1516]|eukprot:XP_005774583.1 hypothetical protein EMIHUDRAFT_207283 [Emiliania huxleyi CCMP1516]
MSKVSGGCGGKSKGGKSRSKGVGSDVAAVRTVKLSTSANGDVVSTLRRALRNDDGTDRDLLNDLPAGLRALKRSGLDLEIEFHSGKKLNRADAKVCLAMCREELQEEYEVSGYGWDEEDKWGELTSSESRLLLFREAVGRRIVGYASFRLTLQGECWNCMEGSPCLFVYDLLVLPEYRRKGVGKQALLTLEMAARKARLAYVCALVTSASALGPPFLSAIKGWRDDTAAVLQMDAADPDDDSFRVYAKCVDTSILQAEQQSQTGEAEALSAAPTAERKEPTEGADGADGERNGRPATESEIASWVRTIKEANLSGQDLGADPAAEPADGGLCGETGEAGCVA